MTENIKAYEVKTEKHPWGRKCIPPKEYMARRKNLLDKASAAGSDGDHGKEQKYINQVGALDAQYAEQCRRTLERGTNDGKR